MGICSATIIFPGRFAGVGLMALAMGIGFPVQGRGLTQIFAFGTLHGHDPARMGVDHKDDGLAGQRIRDLKELPQIGDGPVLAHPPGLAVIKQRIQMRRLGAEAADSGEILLIATQGRQALQTPMRPLVVDLLQPGPEPGIEIVQVANPARVQFAQELRAEGAVPALDLALGFGGIGAAVEERYLQPGTDPLP